MLNNNVEIKNEQKPRRKRTYLTPQAWQARVRAYQASGESMSSYCKKHQLALSTFSRWVRKYEGKSAADFIPVLTKRSKVFTEKASHQSEVLRNIEIQSKNIKIIISEIANTNLLVQLIQGISNVTG